MNKPNKDTPLHRQFRKLVMDWYRGLSTKEKKEIIKNVNEGQGWLNKIFADKV